MSNLQGEWRYGFCTNDGQQTAIWYNEFGEPVHVTHVYRGLGNPRQKVTQPSCDEPGYVGLVTELPAIEQLPVGQ